MKDKLNHFQSRGNIKPSSNKRIYKYLKFIYELGKAKLKHLYFEIK